MLIRDITTLRKYVRYNASGTFEGVSPLISDAQNTILNYYLGSALIEQLETFISDNGTDEPTKKLLELAQAALAPLAFMLAVNEGSFSFGDAGHTVTRTEKQAPVSETKLALARTDFKNRGYANIEKLLLFLEDNESTFTAWSLSFYKHSPTSFYFRNATDFQLKGEIAINFSRLFFDKILPTVRFFELTDINDLLPDTISILDPFSPSLSADETYLVSLIQHYVAAKSIEEAVYNSKAEKNPNDYDIDLIVSAVWAKSEYYSRIASAYRAKIIGCLKDRFAIDNTLDFNTAEQKIFYAG